MTFAERLTELMQEHDMTNYRLSKTVGCSATTVANWLDGKEITLSYLQKLSEIFEVSIGYLAGSEQKESPLTVSGEGATVDVSDLNTANQEKVKEYAALLLNAQHTEQA